MALVTMCQIVVLKGLLPDVFDGQEDGNFGFEIAPGPCAEGVEHVQDGMEADGAWADSELRELCDVASRGGSNISDVNAPFILSPCASLADANFWMGRHMCDDWTMLQARYWVEQDRVGIQE